MKAYYKNNSMLLKKNWDKRLILLFWNFLTFTLNSPHRNLFLVHILTVWAGWWPCCEWVNMSEIHCMHVITHQYWIYRFTINCTLYKQLTHGPYLSWKKNHWKIKHFENKTLIISKMFSNSIQRILYYSSDY